MKLEGLTGWHCLWAITWTAILFATVSSPSPHQLNWKFAIEIAGRFKQGGGMAYQVANQKVDELDQWSINRWEKPTQKKRKPGRLCYVGSDGKERC